jgi:hypothetical protein
MRPLLLICFSFLCSFLQAQKDLENYIPEHGTQDLIIRVKLHIIQKSASDPGNYTLADTNVLRKQFQLINDFYNSLDRPTLASPAALDYIPWAKVRFQISDIHFLISPQHWDRIAWEPYRDEKKYPAKIDSVYGNGKIIVVEGNHKMRFRKGAEVFVTNGVQQWSIKTDSSQFSSDTKQTTAWLPESIPALQKGLTISYYFENNRNCNADLFKEIAQSDSTHLHVFYTGSSMKNAAFGCGPSPFYLNVSNYLKGGEWANAQLSAHELGHCLGLSHTDNPQFPDLPKTDKFGFIDCDSIAVSNNIMGYNKCRRYLSPLQIAHVHREYSTKPMRILTLQQCFYSKERSIEVNRNMAWNRALVCGGDIIVKKGKSLTIKNMVSMPEGGHIILEDGASLIIDGGTITNNCGSTWGGFLFTGKFKGNKNALSTPKKKATITIVNGGRTDKIQTK